MRLSIRVAPPMKIPFMKSPSIESQPAQQRIEIRKPPAEPQAKACHRPTDPYDPHVGVVPRGTSENFWCPRSFPGRCLVQQIQTPRRPYIAESALLQVAG